MNYRICSLFSGSSGNATYLGSKDANILVDAGKSLKQISEALRYLNIEPCQLDGILITHEHSDHIKSVQLLSKKFDIPIYANIETWNAMENHKVEVVDRNKRIFSNSTNFAIKDIEIHAFPISHDAASPVGFNFFCGSKEVSIITDLGYIDSDTIDCIKDSDIVYLEANHDVDMLKSGAYPFYLKKRILGKKGHLSNLDAGLCLATLINHKVTHAILSHLSLENNLPGVAFNTVKNVLNSKGIEIDRDVVLDLAYRDIVGNIYYI